MSIKAGHLTLQSFELKQLELPERTVLIGDIQHMLKQSGLKFRLHRTDGIKLDEAEEDKFDEVYCGHDHKVVKPSSTDVATVIPPPRRRKPV